MKSKVSALMDGELEKQDASNVIKALRKNDELQQEWKNYHLIGDALRQSSRLSMNISSHVNQKLKNEPIAVLFPDSSHISRQQKTKVFALSIAASVMMMITAWIIVDNNTTSEPKQSIVAENPTQDSNIAVVPVMVSPPASLNNYPPIEINDYLSVHREFSPGADMRGQVTNVNSTEYREKHGR